MKRILIALLFFGLIGAVAGCAVVPVGATHRTTTTQSADGHVITTDDYDYIGDGTPIAVAAYPGVAFYPRYVAECFCIWPVAYYGGVWINYLGAPVVYHGGWNRPPPQVRNAYVRGFHGGVHQGGFRHVPRGHFNGRPGIRQQQQRSLPQRGEPQQRSVPQRGQQRQYAPQQYRQQPHVQPQQRQQHQPPAHNGQKRQQ